MGVYTLTDAITIRGVLGRLSTLIQNQPSTPPAARAKVNDGTLYIPWTVRDVLGAGKRTKTYRLPRLFHQELQGARPYPL